MLNLKRRVISLERRILADASLPFDWSEIGEIDELLAGAIDAEDQGRRLTVPEINAATDLARNEAIAMKLPAKDLAEALG